MVLLISQVGLLDRALTLLVELESSLAIDEDDEEIEDDDNEGEDQDGNRDGDDDVFGVDVGGVDGGGNGGGGGDSERVNRRAWRSLRHCRKESANSFSRACALLLRR